MQSIDGINITPNVLDTSKQSQPRGASPPFQQISPTRSSHSSDTLLDPEEESPPVRNSTIRTADQIDQAEHQNGPAHSTDRPAGSTVTFCLCQPEPRVPRPRNAFILYRQTHQATVAAHNPGLANPDISKIIGEQWSNEPEDEKSRWKAYAEEEKLQHQQKYPEYRYRPRRAGRRTSVSSDTTPFPYSELRKCQKCGGRNIIDPSLSTPSPAREKPSGLETSPSSTFPIPSRAYTIQLPPPTPSSATTPSTRYLPMLNNLSLDSPQGRKMTHGRPPHRLQLNYQGRNDDREYGNSPESKRRRFESPQGTFIMSTRPMPARHNTGPGTPFPFPQIPQPQQMAPNPYAPFQGSGHVRRESLPPPAEILRGRADVIGPPDVMAPPPRPGLSYSQHRLSQGQMRAPGHELSLTLPPLQTANMTAGQGNGHDGKATAGYTPVGSNGSRGADGRRISEIIMSMPFLGKVNILGRIAPPLPQEQGAGDGPRGRIIAIEGDDVAAAQMITEWLREFFSREDDIIVKVIDGPKMPDGRDEDEFQVQDLFKVIGEWHDKAKEVLALVRPGQVRKDSARTALVPEQEAEPAVTKDQSMTQEETSVSDDRARGAKSDDAMDVDEASPSVGPEPKVIVLLRTYTLTATNAWASRIAIKDAYLPSDHWQWAATLWRGIPGPDVTVYVRDISSKHAAAREEFGTGGVEIKKAERVMAVRRVKGSEGKDDRSGCEGVSPAALRRLGFEIGEWVRGVGGAKGQVPL
ncbi:hypothetical protein MBLNU459_g3468t2 [Dothideomycetes sp. NU459]